MILETKKEWVSRCTLKWILEVDVYKRGTWSRYRTDDVEDEQDAFRMTAYLMDHPEFFGPGRFRFTCVCRFLLGPTMDLVQKGRHKVGDPAHCESYTITEIGIEDYDGKIPV